MSDTESDKDLRRAIALSLMSSDPQPPDAVLINEDDDEDDDNLDKPRSSRLLSTASEVSEPISHKTVADLSTAGQGMPRTERERAPRVVGMLGLNRTQMEDERIARAALGRGCGGDPFISAASGRKRKASASPTPLQARAREVKKRLENEHERREPDSQRYVPKKELLKDSGLSGIQYPDGIIKKTWAFGYDREGDDIKIEEVLQKCDLQLAVLSSFQIDADCEHSILNRLHLREFVR